MLDDTGLQNSGCRNVYLKQPHVFLEDYRRLVDAASALGVGGIVLWGFLRDQHGGVAHAKRVVEYAASKNVAIYPGVGTTCYGGIYYQGDHRYSLSRFLEKNPDARMMDSDGSPLIFNDDYYLWKRIDNN